MIDTYHKIKNMFDSKGHALTGNYSKSEEHRYHNRCKAFNNRQFINTKHIGLRYDSTVNGRYYIGGDEFRYFGVGFMGITFNIWK